MLLLLRLMLAASSAAAAADSASTGSFPPEKSSSSNSGERSQLAEVEASLLSLLGMKKRPRPQKSSHVPDPMKRLYDKQNTFGAAGIAKPGIHVRSSNTVRTFSHIGKS